MSKDEGRHRAVGWGEHAACQAVREHTRVHTQGMAQTHKQVQTIRHGPPNRADFSCSYTHTHTLPNPVLLRTQGSMRPARPPPPHLPHRQVWLPPWALGAVYFHCCAPPLPRGLCSNATFSPGFPTAAPPPPPNPAESMTLLHWAFLQGTGLFHFSLPRGPPNSAGPPPPGGAPALKQMGSVQA